MKVVEETFRQLLQKVWYLWRQEIFMYIDDNFAINLIHPKFQSLLLKDKNHIEKSQKIFVRGAYPVIQSLCIT